MHMSVQAQAVVYTMSAPDGSNFWTMNLRATCTTCGMPFFFPSEFPIAPPHAAQLLGGEIGAFRAMDCSEMGVVLRPAHGDSFFTMEAEGRA